MPLAAGLPLTTVIPGTMRYLHETSMDEASFWRADTAKRHIARKYTFPSLPWPIRDDWNRLEDVHQYVLELSYADGATDSKEKWRKSVRLICNIPGIDRRTPVQCSVHEKWI